MKTNRLMFFTCTKKNVRDIFTAVIIHIKCFFLTVNCSLTKEKKSFSGGNWSRTGWLSMNTLIKHFKNLKIDALTVTLRSQYSENHWNWWIETVALFWLILWVTTQSANTCPKLTIKTLEQAVKYVQS